MTTPKHTELPERLSVSPSGNLFADVKCVATRFGNGELIQAIVTRYNQHAELIRQRDELLSVAKMSLYEIGRLYGGQSADDFESNATVKALRQALTPKKEK